MDLRGAGGMVLIAVLLLTLLISALGVALSLTASSEALIAANFRERQEARYAAAAAAERAIAEIEGVADWNQLLDGRMRSAFFSGSLPEPRMLTDGSALVLEQLRNLASCRKETACSSAEMDSVTNERPWGINNPRWQLFAAGWLRDMAAAGVIDSAYYTVVMIGDDPLETDGDPLRDAPPAQAGAAVVVVRAYAFGPRGARHAVEATVARIRDGRVRAIAWHDRR